MRNFLMATTAFALAGGLAAAPAAAADMMSLGVGGYMQQWFGHASRDDKGAEGGWDTQADTEIHFKGSLESDMGLTFTVHVELEGNNDQVEAADKKTDETEIDESFVRISGGFGQLEMGQRDHGMVRMHESIKDVGIGLNAGDTHKWIPGAYLETSGHAYAGGDDLKLNYFTPRVSGFQFGVSYAPDQENENKPETPPNGNDDAAWGVGMNFKQDVGDMAFTFSLGHVSISQNEMTAGYWADNTQDTSEDAMAMMKSFDDKSYSNIGLGVGMGSFAFNVAYAMGDNGGYMLQCTYGSGDAAAMRKCADDQNETTLVFQPGPDGEDNASAAVSAVKAVKDKTTEWTSMGVSAVYTDGPLAVSIGHMVHEEDAGGERTSTMLSTSYSLAPGVAWATSIFAVEDDTSHKSVTGEMNEGHAFVTGIKLAF